MGSLLSRHCVMCSVFSFLVRDLSAGKQIGEGGDRCVVRRPDMKGHSGDRVGGRNGW